MKKILFSMAILTFIGGGSFGVAQAQNEYREGNIALEVQANPFSASFSTFRLGDRNDPYKIKAKYFLGDNHALRIGVGFSRSADSRDLGAGSNTETTVTDTRPGSTTTPSSPAHPTITTNSGTRKNVEGQVSFDLGYEFHFFDKERIDLYAGAQAFYVKNYFKETTDYLVKTDSWSSYGSTWKSYTLYDKYEEEYSDRNSNGDVSERNIGFGIFTGINYYIYKGIYIGAEIGVSVNSSSNLDSSYDYNYRNDYWQYSDERVYTETTHTKTTYDGATVGKNIDVEFYAIPALRLGWNF